MNANSRVNPAWEVNGRPHVRKEEYISKEFAALEDTHLWPKVWQVACHESELAKVGDFVTYDIADESIIVVRTKDEALKAYHNVCPHRGRALADASGSAQQFRCKYHGWRFDLDGNNVYVHDEEDWGNTLCRADLKLHTVRVDTWAGWVWVNMDLDAQSLLSFLGPVAERTERFELHNCRIRWYKTFELACNWKLVLEAFNEGYHVAGSHPELLQYSEDYTEALAYGLHGAYWQSSLKAPNNSLLMGRSRRLGGTHESDDFRKYLVRFTEDFDQELRAMVTTHAVAAARQVMEELPPTATQPQVIEKWMEKRKEIAAQKGINWPDLTPEYMNDAHHVWHVFPNTVFLHVSIDGVLWYRARPLKGNPERCLYDVWSLERYPEGEQPEYQHEVYPDWRVADPGRILAQDYGNLERVQRGMHSMAFRESRLNPRQEIVISNFHRALHDWLKLEP
jgi:phenylpropionate dioxygenase-like ring-hydroxylating dioxygenase large terminal subunit